MAERSASSWKSDAFSEAFEFYTEVEGEQLVTSIVVDPDPKGSDPKLAHTSIVVDPDPKGSDPKLARETESEHPYTSIVVDPDPKGSDPKLSDGDASSTTSIVVDPDPKGSDPK